MYWQCCDVIQDRQLLQKAYLELSPSCKAHIDRLRRQEDKDRSLTGYRLAGQLLKTHYGVDAIVCRKENGRPYFEGCDLFVSISHSQGKVACAVSEEPVGIDIEKIRPIDLRICRHTCVDPEKEYLLAGKPLEEGIVCEDPDTLYRFYEIWTAKEAYFKKQGTGITDLKSVNILTLNRTVYTKEDFLIQII